MKNFLLHSIVIDMFSMLSFSLFLITGDKLTFPLGLLFFLSLFQEISFFSVSFGLAFVCWVFSLMVNTKKWWMILKGSYVVLSVSIITAFCIGSPSMIKEIPTLISIMVFLFLQGLFCWKWWTRIYRQ
jgi:hypothetical protein